METAICSGGKMAITHVLRESILKHATEKGARSHQKNYWADEYLSYQKPKVWFGKMRFSE